MPWSRVPAPTRQELPSGTPLGVNERNTIEQRSLQENSRSLVLKSGDDPTFAASTPTQTVVRPRIA